MLVALVKAALLSSTAFFIKAAAKTVTVLSCAIAGRGAATVVAATAIAAAKVLKGLNIWRSVIDRRDRTRIPRRDPAGSCWLGDDQTGSAVPGAGGARDGASRVVGRTLARPMAGGKAPPILSNPRRKRFVAAVQTLISCHSCAKLDAK